MKELEIQPITANELDIQPITTKELEIQPITAKELEIQPIMMSGPTIDTKKQWIPRKMTEGQTRPLMNMTNETPSQYYKLSTMTLQDHAMNAMFDNGDVATIHYPHRCKNCIATIYITTRIKNYENDSLRYIRLRPTS